MSLPKDWTVTKYFNSLEIRDENGETQTWVAYPYDPMTTGELIDIGMENIKKNKVKQFMARNSSSCYNDVVGEVNTTFLAELSAAEFDLDFALDDETHWIWELAAEYQKD